MTSHGEVLKLASIGPNILLIPLTTSPALSSITLMELLMLCVQTSMQRDMSSTRGSSNVSDSPELRFSISGRFCCQCVRTTDS